MGEYHLVTRGDGRRTLFHDDGHYSRFTQGLSDEASRSGWIMLAFCRMPNHVHALIKTPEPNLCRGMQHWLSRYANWCAASRRPPANVCSPYRDACGRRVGRCLNRLEKMKAARRFIKRATITETDCVQIAGDIMDTETMGRVLTTAMIENLEDIWAAKRGLVGADQIRRIEVTDALVDSGATLLSIPSRLIQKLGLDRVTTKKVSSSIGPGEANIYSAVRLTIQGRSCTMDVMEVPDGVPILIGQLPLEHLDFVVDMRSHSLIGNPAHGGEHIYELM